MEKELFFTSLTESSTERKKGVLRRFRFSATVKTIMQRFSGMMEKLLAFMQSIPQVYANIGTLLPQRHCTPQGISLLFLLLLLLISCSRSNDYHNKLIGPFYSGNLTLCCLVSPSGSLYKRFSTRTYQLPVMGSIFVRKCHRGKGSGLLMLKDFVLSYSEASLGLKYPLSDSMYRGK